MIYRDAAMSLLTDVCNKVGSDACVFFPPQDVVHLKQCRRLLDQSVAQLEPLHITEVVI